MELEEINDIVDTDFIIQLDEIKAGDPGNDQFPSYRFLIVAKDGNVMGHIDLIIGNSKSIIFYSGHFGCTIKPEYRGNNYAARSIQLLLPVAKSHGINPIWLTCNPDNIASRKSCKKAGALLVEITDVPPDSVYYSEGDHTKCRYRLDIK